jgi:hypothetical protein
MDLDGSISSSRDGVLTSRSQPTSPCSLRYILAGVGCQRQRVGIIVMAARWMAHPPTDTRLEDFIEGGIIVAGDDGEVLEEGDDGDTCDCDELPESVPCWPSYRDGATFGG